MLEVELPEEDEEESRSASQKEGQSSRRNSAPPKDWSKFGAKRGSSSVMVGEGHGSDCEENCEHIQKAKASFWKTTKDLNLLHLKKAHAFDD